MRPWSVLHPFCLIAPAAALCGCGGQPGDSATAPPGVVSPAATATAVDAGSTAGESTVALQSIDKAGLDAAIKANAGKVVFVDFWATWCGPCKAGFPHTVAMSEKYADQGLAVISVSCDEADGRQGALEFLQQQQANFANYIATDGMDAIESFEIDGGALPYYRIYGRDGQLVTGFGPDPDKGVSPEEIEALIQQALDTSKS